MRSLGVTAVVLGACAGQGPERIGAQPSWRNGAVQTSVAGPVTFAPTSEAVAHYNEPLQLAPRSALGDAVTAAVAEAAARAGVPVPVADARLFRACTELAEVVPEDGIPAYAMIEFALHRNGIIEPSPRLLIVRGDVDSPESIVQQLAPRLAELLGEGATSRLGVGAAKRRRDGTGTIVFALQGSSVATSPIPRAAPAGGTFVIDAVLDPRYRDPEVFVTYHDGVTRRLELRAGRAGKFTTQIACGTQKGRQQIEISASDAAGSTVLANFPVWCAMAPPTSVTVAPPHEDVPVASADEAERRLLASVTRDRASARLSTLGWDDRLAAVARSYAEEMRRTGVVAHVSPISGSVGDRVRAANIRVAVVFENLARAYGVNEAHEGLMNSPGHRANLMSSLATHIGIGVALGEEISGRREIFVAQVFTRVPPKLDPVKAIEAVQRKLQGARRSLTWAALLQMPAQQYASALATGKSHEEAYDAVRPQLEGLGKRYQKIGTLVTATPDLDALDGASLVTDTAADEVGVGIAQGAHPELGDSAIWIVVMHAHRR